MKIVSIKRLVLSLVLTLGSVATLPAYAWPDTDEMNMCGTAVKAVRADFNGWAQHDIFISARGLDYYYKTNCPESKATKNYKGKNWTPDAKMAAKPKKVKSHKKHAYKHKKRMKKVHNKKYNKKSDCVAVDRLNTFGPVVRRVNHRSHNAHDNFYRNAQAVLNMGKTKKFKTITKKVDNDYCVVTDGLNTGGSAVRVVSNKYH